MTKLYPILRWTFFLIVFLTIRCAGQNCCDFMLVNKNDTLTKNQLVAVEIPTGKIALISFVNLPPVYVPVTYIIDNNEAVVKYVGTWEHPTNTRDPFYKNTCSASTTVNSYAEITFTGTLEMYSTTGPGHGKLGVSLNGGPEIEKDLYSATRIENVMIFNSLQPGTIRIRVKSGYVVLDYFKNTK